MAVLQWNMRDFCTHKSDLELLVRDYDNPICVCLQETKLKLGHNVIFKDYSFISSNNLHGGEPSNTGVLIRKGIPFKQIRFPSDIKFTAVKLFYRK